MIPSPNTNIDNQQDPLEQEEQKDISQPDE